MTGEELRGGVGVSRRVMIATRRMFAGAVCIAMAGCQSAIAPSVLTSESPEWAEPEPGKLEPARSRPETEAALAAETYELDIYPFFEEHCFTCHSERRQRADLNLEQYGHVSAIAGNMDLWERVVEMLESSQMPPEDEPRPLPGDVEEIAGFVKHEIDAAILAMQPDPGRVTARRLNRQEYDNTTRDLLGVDLEAAQDFPVDDSGYGFDNIGDVLTVSPLLMEKYLTAAEELSAAAVKADMKRAAAGSEEAPRILTCQHENPEHGRQCARRILRELARKAYRRPVTPEEVRGLTGLVELAQAEGDSFENGIGLAIQAILVSPHFLFLIEQDTRGKDPDAVEYLNDFELASRLSYFLWSSMPDEELYGLAERGELREPTVLDKQARRMLGDPKAKAFVENFAGQWLELRNLETVRPVSKKFPEYNSKLNRAMRRESELFFEYIVREDRSLLELLDADYTFLNEQLAKHYGVEGVDGDGFQRVALATDQRGGVLTQGSVLAVTSYPSRTSPVLRGKWILENILGTPPPPPPDDVPALVTDEEKIEGTLREQLEKHRSSTSCASCHQKMDPLGFALENYDAVGKWRTHEGDHPVDSAGRLPNGQTFNGPKELRALLLTRADDFVRCLTEKMLTYAIGRGVEDFDRPVVYEIEQRVRANEYSFSSLVLGIIESPPFQMRRGEGGGEWQRS